MDYIKAFIVGGAICLIAQVILDRTKLTPAHILVSFVTAGVILGGLGLYEPLVKFGGSGAKIPISGFGYTLAKGTGRSKDQGIYRGPVGRIRKSSRGIAAAVLFGYIMAVVFNPNKGLRIYP